MIPFLKSVFTSLKEVSAAMLAKASTSALEAPEVKALKFTPYLKDQLASILPNAPKGAGFVIPYFDFCGKPIKFFRYRYLETVIDKKGKITRYTQPLKADPEIYLPPLLGKRQWKDMLGNKDIPIHITEGELKAACATNMGFLTIGLGGVYNYRIGKQEVELLDTLKSFEWSGRYVYIIYDSDAASNEMVMRAEQDLAKTLGALGAFIHIVRLPSVSDTTKTGLDDFLVAKGPEALRKLLHKTEQWNHTKHLHDMNTKVILVHHPPMVIELNTSAFMKVNDFKNVNYRPMKFLDSREDKPKLKYTAEEWIEWPGRAEVLRVTFKPGAPRITSQGEFNMWKGWAVEPCAGDITPWMMLFSHITQSLSEEHRLWFLRWLACPIQRPGIKMESAVLVWGIGQGTGKTFLGNTMARIYGDSFGTVTTRELESDFTDWSLNKQFIVGNEVTGNEARKFTDPLKTLIDSRSIRINIKGIPAYMVPSCMHMYFTSNHENALYMEEGDRRIFVCEAPKFPLPDKFYTDLEQWLDKDGGASILMHYLMTLDLGDFNPVGRPPLTASKREMISLGMSDLGLLASRLRDEPGSILQVNGTASSRALWTTREIHAVVREEHKVTENSLARAMKAAGIEKLHNGLPILTADGPHRLWAMFRREEIAKMEPLEIAKLYNQERGLVAKPTTATPTKKTRNKF
jgi:hypothetical protein